MPDVADGTDPVPIEISQADLLHCQDFKVPSALSDCKSSFDETPSIRPRTFCLKVLKMIWKMAASALTDAQLPVIASRLMVFAILLYRCC